MFVIVDTETTGLDPTKDLLLEVGIVVADRALNETASLGVTLGLPKFFDPASVDPFVNEMHKKNGLWDDCTYGGLGWRDAEAKIVSFLCDITTPGWIAMTGSTVDFDRNVLRHRMPRVESWFHYRSINVSSLKILVNEWGTLNARWQSSPNKAHRAVADARETLQELRHYKREIFDQVPADRRLFAADL